MVGHGGSSAGSYLADPTSPIPSHCSSIVVTSTLRVNTRWYKQDLHRSSVTKCDALGEKNICSPPVLATAPTALSSLGIHISISHMLHVMIFTDKQLKDTPARNERFTRGWGWFCQILPAAVNKWRDKVNKTHESTSLVHYSMLWTLRYETCKEQRRTSTRVFPGTGTGALSSLRIHVSISRTSCMMRLGVASVPCPVITPHTLSLQHSAKVKVNERAKQEYVRLGVASLLWPVIMPHKEIYRISSNTAQVLNWTRVNLPIQIEKFKYFLSRFQPLSIWIWVIMDHEIN